jgi:hypothetical protein
MVILLYIYNDSLHLDHNGITDVGLRAIADGLRKNKSLKKLTLWGNKWGVPACEAYAELMGMVEFETKIGTDDCLPHILFASSLRQNPSFRAVDDENPTVVVRPSDIDKKYLPKQQPTSAPLKQQNVDFTIYSIEGVLNVAQRAYDYNEELE